MSEIKLDSAQVRAVLDAAIEVALPAAGGVVRKRLKQLRKALRELDAERAATAERRRAGAEHGEARATVPC